MNLIDQFPRAPKSSHVIALAVTLVGVIGIVDALTGSLVRLIAFYYLPLGMLAWYIGRWAAVAGSLGCGVVWFLANRGGYDSSALVVWNTSVTSVTFVAFSWVLGLLKEDRDRLHHLATEDELTGLLNRRAFVWSLREEIERSLRFHEPLSVAFLDLDGFKKLNDTRGHKAGDVALKLVARTIARRVRATDVAGRLGGDEFVILFPKTFGTAGRIAIKAVVGRLNQAMAKRGFRITFSVGLISYEVPPKTADAVLQDADELMYEAKRSGKNRIVLHEVSAQVDHRNSLEKPTS